MKVLIVGYGSIGKKHYEIIKELEYIKSIDIVTRQNVNVKSYKYLEDILDISKYNYIIIASETAKHYEQLKYINNCVEDKIILVEKPLYDKRYEDIKRNNKIFIAYNLRFHPILQRLKSLLKDEEILYANIFCGQFLPTWRDNQDYKKSYSADISRGGGVLRDLSHELDYIIWIFGDLKNIKYISTKISDLEINSDDIFTAICIAENKSIINVTMDYISKIPMRHIVVHTLEYTIVADLIKNFIIIKDKSEREEKIIISNIDSNYTYIKMHESLLSKNYKNICDLDIGKKVVDLIDSIELKEL